MACDHGEEVVAVFQAVDYASADAVNVFKHGAVFNAGYVARHYGAQRRTLKAWGECGGKRRVEAANGEVGAAAESHFFCVARSAYHYLTLWLDAEMVGHIGRDDGVVLGHDAFDGAYHIFVRKIGGYFLQVALEIGRRYGEQQGVGFAAHLVDVR